MEILGISFGMAAVWIVAAVILIIIEAITLGLVTIWFVGGAVAAAITTLFTDNIIIQVIVFLVVSIALLILTKPMRTKLKIGKEKTNVEEVVGRQGFVVEKITPTAFGQVKVGGITWTAGAKDENSVIEVEEKIIVCAVDGVKLIVEPAQKK